MLWWYNGGGIKGMSQKLKICKNRGGSSEKNIQVGPRINYILSTII